MLDLELIVDTNGQLTSFIRSQFYVDATYPESDYTNGIVDLIDAPIITTTIPIELTVTEINLQIMNNDIHLYQIESTLKFH